ncbi:MAG: NAD(P)/FAD-dependent oxidoreductase [Brachymonas sp.]|nr:NAD(P)/FAD-dependent oxidoreductase [Brachymonas sp.]
MHQIVIVGGGAGGLSLATQLGNRLGKRGKADVILIDRSRAHVWKPMLHEIAAGSMDIDAHDLDYLAQAHWHHFSYRFGEMVGLDRTRREVLLAPVLDDDGQQISPARRIPYDTLILAVGSKTNDFGTPGVAQHTLKLETAEDARYFNRRLIDAALRANTDPDARAPHRLRVAIIGAGATGVELAAELHRTMRELVAYGLNQINAETGLAVVLIEAGPRILPMLPERLSAAAEMLLRKLGVEVLTGAKVNAIEPGTVMLDGGKQVDAELVVWAAGVKAPVFLSQLDGLETNRIHQLTVRPTLQTTQDDRIFALGDCADCPWLGTEKRVPPRAQAADQQAGFMVGQIMRLLGGEALHPYQYRDYGSLVSLGQYSTVGSLMGGLVGKQLLLEGWFAGVMYRYLYTRHQLALHGWSKVLLEMLARAITRRTEPRVKLH